MNNSMFPRKQLDAFFKASTSLKLYSRAELNDEKNRSLIEKLYIDPLPNDQVFKICMSDNTTILYGRKGTGKSTIFQRVQHEIRKNESNIISAYMDIRNVFESSQIDPITFDRIANNTGAMPAEQVQKLLLYKRFLKTLILDIRNELKSQIESNYISKVVDRVKGTSAEIFAGLDHILEHIDNPEFERIDGISNVATTTEYKDSSNNTTQANVSFGPMGPQLGANISEDVQSGEAVQALFTKMLIRILNVSDIINELKAILGSAGIRYLYIFLDDFSELPEDAMRLLVETLVSPLTRWSDFIKFKIAAYPGRVYLGSIDKTKIEEFYLDIYGLYGGAGVAKMEEKSTDFVKRLVERRILVYGRVNYDVFFETRSEEIWRVLFFASMGNPRILGHIMLYAYEANLLYGRKIGVRAIQEAAQRYYEEKVAAFFATGIYRMAFHERSSVYSLKELLEKIVSRARNLRQKDRSRETGSRRDRAYSSHFYISHEFDDILTSLELGFFITKYFEQSDRAGNRVSVYALNYGLCTKYQIQFGRPSGRREDRLYFVERVFDYNSIIRSYMIENQEIRCEQCQAVFDISMLPGLKLIRMQCPNCRSGSCTVVNLSRKYGDVIESIKPGLLLPDAELGILQTLHYEKRDMVASEIAGELDCSGQLVGRRARHLAERSLVERQQAGQVYKYKISRQAETAYFSERDSADLDLSRPED